MDKRRFFEIVETETGRVVKRIEVTRKSESQRDRVERGILLQIDRDKYHTREIGRKGNEDQTST